MKFRMILTVCDIPRRKGPNGAEANLRGGSHIYEIHGERPSFQFNNNLRFADEKQTIVSRAERRRFSTNAMFDEIAVLKVHFHARS